MKNQLHMETLMQMLKSHPPTSSDPRESHLWVPPHNKLKKGVHTFKTIQTKASKPSGASQQGPKAHCMVCKAHIHKRTSMTLEAKRPWMMGQLKLLRNTPLLSQMNRRRGRPTHVQPWAEGKICTDKKKAGQQQDTLLIPWCQQCFQKGFSAAWGGCPQRQLSSPPKRTRTSTQNKLKRPGLPKRFCQNKELCNEQFIDKWTKSPWDFFINAFSKTFFPWSLFYSHRFLFSFLNPLWALLDHSLQLPLAFQVVFISSKYSQPFSFSVATSTCPNTLFNQCLKNYSTSGKKN